MGNIIQFQGQYKNNKILTIPNIFTSLYEKYKKRQDDITKKKIEFLQEQAFQYFYDIQENVAPINNEDKIEIPTFIQKIEIEKRRIKIARDNANRAVLEVVKNKKVNECYQKRIKQLKQMAKQTRKSIR